MKVLNVNMSLDAVEGGGTAERTFQMSKYLAKSGVECTVLTTNLGLTGERVNQLKGVQIIALPCINRRFYIPKFSYRLIKQIIADVDIIHLMGHWTLINALVYFIVRALGKPYVVCPAGALSIYGRSQFIKSFYNWIVGKRIIRNANKLIAITADEINQFRDYGIDKDKVSIIPNGINVEDCQATDVTGFRKKYGLGNKPFIMFMGRLNSIKGPDLLLRAFCIVKDKLRDFHLVYVGPDGGMLSELTNMATKLGASIRVHFIGYLGGEDKFNAYHASELLTIPSRQEAMSIVVLEAGITGTPVLLTDQCGFNEIEEIGGGMVVEPSVKDLQKGLSLLFENPEKLKKMGEKLKNHVLNSFTWESIIKSYISLYEKILAVT